ncbi:MAG: cbb3-type cytochrome c oxidase subunit I [bacterium]
MANVIQLEAKAERHTTALGYMLSAAGFTVIGATFGLIGGTELIAPDLLGNIPWIMFGRLRAMHTNLVMFGFVVTMLIGAAHYITPVLLKTPLHSEKVGLVSLAVWDLSLIAGVGALSLGHTQSREYAELAWPADIGITAAFLLMLYNFTRTVMDRREKILYVTNWYFVGGLFLSAATYVIGNVMWVPWKGALHGMPDAVIHWFYGHNVLGLMMTPLAVGAAYYVIPKAAGAPLYSHTLSLIGFWSLLVMYTHIGTHHLLQAPAPTWLKLIAIVDSIAMIIPVATVLVNLWMTAKGRIAAVTQDIAARFVFVGTILYLIVCIQGPFQSLPVVQRITHFTNWIPAHSHLAVLGFVGMIAFGTFYFILPGITGRPIHSRGLAVMQYWLMLMGVSGMMVVLTIAGLVQGHAWFHGETVYRVLPSMFVYNVTRVMVGALIVTGACIGLYNVVRSLQAAAREEQTPVMPHRTEEVA